MKNLCFKFSNLGYIYLATADDSEESSIVSSFVDAWSDEGVIDEISEQTGSTFKYVMAGPKPVIIIDNVLNCIDLTPVVSIIQEKHKSFGNEDVRTLAKLLTAKVGVNFTDGEDGDAQDFINVVVEFTERLNQTSDNFIYKYLSPKFPAEDGVRAIVEKNSVGRNKNYAVGAKNETLYMNNPEAEVFIRIPSDEELRLYYREGVIELPPKAAFMKDYKYPECNTRSYKRYCQSDPTLLKEVQGDPDNNINVNKGKAGVTATNTLDANGIFPNELDYYKSICNLMDATSEALVEVKKLREETIEKNRPKEEADLQAYHEAKRLAEERADEAEAKVRRELDSLLEIKRREKQQQAFDNGEDFIFDKQTAEKEIIEQARALANTTAIIRPKYPKTDKDFLEMEPLSSEDEFCRSVRYYVCHLIERAAVFNWSHTGNVTIYRDNIDDGVDDDNDSDNDEVMSSRQRYAEAGDGTLDTIDSLEIIYAVYDYLIQTDPHSIAEFLIKMLRWGSRKPTKVVFSSENIEKEFDLSRFILTNKTFGYANSEKIVRNGVEFYYAGYITTTNMFKCAAYFNDVGATTVGVPIGIVTLRFFKTPKGEQIAQQVYMSLLDVLEILREEPNKIHGISLNQNGTIKVTAPENEAKMTIDIAMKNAIDSAASDQRFKIYESGRVVELALQFGLKNISSVLYLSLIKDLLFNSRLNLIIEDKNFQTLQEGKELCKTNDVNTVVMGKIGNEVILKFAKVLHEASLEPEFSIEDALNFASSIFTDVKSPFIAEKGTTGTASAMKALTQKMNIGGEKKMNVREVMLNYLLDDISKCVQYRRLTHGGELICYIGVYKGEDGVLHYVLTTKEEFTGHAKDSSEFLVMAQRVASQLIALPVMDESKYNLLYYKFSSEKAIQEFYHAFKRIPLA